MFAPAARISAVYVPQDNSTPDWTVEDWGSPHWFQMWPGDNQPSSGPDWNIGNLNNVPNWYDQFQSAINGGTLEWFVKGGVIVDGTLTNVSGWHLVGEPDWDQDGIPDSLDLHPTDPNNNSYDWPGGKILYNGGNFLVRAQWFAGDGFDRNNNDVPDCIEPLLDSIASAQQLLWPGGTFAINGQLSTFPPTYFYGYTLADTDGDGIPDALDTCANDPSNNSKYYWPGGTFVVSGISTPILGGWIYGKIHNDADSDSIPDDFDPYPDDPGNNTGYWAGDTFLIDGSWQTLPGSYHGANSGDADGDTIPDDLDKYPTDGSNNTALWQGGNFYVNGVLTWFPAQNIPANDTDANGNGVPDHADPLGDQPESGYFWPPLDGQNPTSVTFPAGTPDSPITITSSYYLGAIVDSDADGIPDPADPYPSDPANGGDSDGDGIPDAIELQYDRNPNNPADSSTLRYATGPTAGLETDGLTWAQAYTYGCMGHLMNPATDSDLDGIPGLYEILNGLNPFNPSDAFDAPIGHLDPAVTTPQLNDFILNIEKYKKDFPLSHIVTDPTEFTFITGRPALIPVHDFNLSVRENDWDDDGVSNADEFYIFQTNLGDLASRPSDAELVEAYYTNGDLSTTTILAFSLLFSSIDTDSDTIPDPIEILYGLNRHNGSDAANQRVVYVNGLPVTDGLTNGEAYALGMMSTLAPSLTATASPASHSMPPGATRTVALTFTNVFPSATVAVSGTTPTLGTLAGPIINQAGKYIFTYTAGASTAEGSSEGITFGFSESYNGHILQSGTVSVTVSIATGGGGGDDCACPYVGHGCTCDAEATSCNDDCQPPPPPDCACKYVGHGCTCDADAASCNNDCHPPPPPDCGCQYVDNGCTCDVDATSCNDDCQAPPPPMCDCGGDACSCTNQADGCGGDATQCSPQEYTCQCEFNILLGTCNCTVSDNCDDLGDLGCYPGSVETWEKQSEEFVNEYCSDVQIVISWYQKKVEGVLQNNFRGLKISWVYDPEIPPNTVLLGYGYGGIMFGGIWLDNSPWGGNGGAGGGIIIFPPPSGSALPEHVHMINSYGQAGSAPQMPKSIYWDGSVDSVAIGIWFSEEVYVADSTSPDGWMYAGDSYTELERNW